MVVETATTTQVQTHSALETHGVVADWKPEVLTVYASTQGTASVREEVAGFSSCPRPRSASSPSTWAAASAPSSAPAISESWSRPPVSQNGRARAA